MRSKRKETGINALALFSTLFSAVFLSASFFCKPSIFHGLWTELELGHFVLFSALYWTLAILLPIVKKGVFASLYLIVLLGTLTGATGIGGIAATALILISSYSFGRIVFPSLSSRYSIPIGLCFWVAIFNILVHFPINYSFVYVCLFLVPIVYRRRATSKELKSFFIGPSNGFNFKDFSNRPYGAQFNYSLLGYCALILSFFVARPELGFDQLSYHFISITQILFEHKASFNLSDNIMVLTPSGGDWAFAMAYLLGGDTAAHLLNFSFAILIAYLITDYFRNIDKLSWGFLASAAFLSTPLVNLETSSLFVENLQTLFIFAGTLLLLDFNKKGDSAKFFGCMIALASSLAVKATSLIYLLALFPFLLWSFLRTRDFKTQLKFKLIFAALAILVFFGLTPYFYSLYKTGNPVFPFMNELFKSPYFSTTQAFNNSLFNTHFSWDTPYEITFHSNKFLEGSIGSFGFHFLYFVPILLCLLPFIRKFETYALFGTTLLFFVITFRFQSYLRYIYPALPGYFVLSTMIAEQGTFKIPSARRLLQFSMVALIGINLYFRPASSYWFRDFNPSLTFDLKSQKAQLEGVAPERLIIDFLNLNYSSNYTLLQLRMPYAALAMGRVRSLAWYHPALAAEFAQATDLQQLRELVLRQHISHICRTSNLPLSVAATKHERLFREFIDLYSTTETNISYLELRKFNPDMRPTLR